MKKKVNIIVEIAMYVIMVLQLGYVFVGNVLHEWMGMLLGILLIVHIIMKRKWFVRVLGLNKKPASNAPGNPPRKQRWLTARRVADLLIVLLLLDMIVLAVTSMGISRTLLPSNPVPGNATLHRYLGAIALALAVAHGEMRMYFKSKRKKRTGILMAISVILILAIGLEAVPYLNRHYRTVEVTTDPSVTEALPSSILSGEQTLIIYFTRVGNTDFKKDVDVVSGASLLTVNGEMQGNTQFMADKLQGFLSCDKVAITLTGKHYPSSYGDTIAVASKELKNQARPAIKPIDVKKYENIILVYPIWWGTIPMPVATFLEESDLTGKQIYLIATQGSSGFVSSTEDIKELAEGATVTEGISVYCDDIPKSGDLLKEWLQTLPME